MSIDDKLSEMNKDEELKRAKKAKEDAERLLNEEKNKNQSLEDEINKLKSYIKINEIAEKNNKKRADEYKNIEIQTSANKNQGETGEQINIIKSYLRGLSNCWLKQKTRSKEEQIAKDLVSEPDFPHIYENALVLQNPISRIEYLLMEGLQRGILDMSIDQTKFLIAIAPLGLNLICPYYVPTDNAFNKCTIDGKEIDAACNGQYWICKPFKEYTQKFATGELAFVKSDMIFHSAEIIISRNEKEDRENELMDRIEEYWRED